MYSPATHFCHNSIVCWPAGMYSDREREMQLPSVPLIQRKSTALTNVRVVRLYSCTTTAVRRRLYSCTTTAVRLVHRPPSTHESAARMSREVGLNWSKSYVRSQIYVSPAQAFIPPSQSLRFSQYQVTTRKLHGTNIQQVVAVYRAKKTSTTPVAGRKVHIAVACHP
eukprot:COSAG01_NODE_3359_length_6191_cov_21.406291_2_plen_167_part_00